MTTRRSLLLIGLLGAAGPAAAQVSLRAPGGTLSGVVRDSADGRPIAYALVLVVGKDQRVFATESGRFRLTGLPSGPTTIRVQQIGFRAQAIPLRVDTRAGGPAPVAPLVVSLARQALRLPEIVVEGNSCTDAPDLGSTGSDEAAIVELAFINAERILAMERKYPFVLEYQRVVTMLDSSYDRIDGLVDTIRKDSRKYAPYRAGRVLDRPGTRFEKALFFTSSDIASDEFQRNHCFWYAGRDSVEGFPGYRIQFAPRPGVTTADWAGAFLIDSASMTLLRTESQLVNLPTSGTSFLSALCTVFYQPIYPSLPQEFQVRCVSAQKRDPPHFRVERWLLASRTFVGKSPDEPDPEP